MARTRKGIPPSYPSQPHNGQARITVRLTTGTRHCIYLGTFGSQDSRKEYQRVLALLESNGGRYPTGDSGKIAIAGLTINEVVAAFWPHAEEYYRLADGSPSREQDHYEAALRPMLDLYGDTPIAEFGPLKLKALRQKLIDRRKYLIRLADDPQAKPRWLPQHRVKTQEGTALWSKKWIPAVVLRSRPALSRKVINQRIDHVKRFVGWSVSAELVAPAVHDALLRVAGLRRGYAGTRDTAKVKPVPDADVEAALPHLPPQVAAMVQLQRLTGARSTEVCLMVGRNIVGRDSPVWMYQIDPNQIAREDEDQRLGNLHKTAHHEQADGSAVVKILPLGPRAQAILKPWLRDNPDEYLFQLREARAARYAERRKDRKTPLWPSHLATQDKKRKADPKRAPRDHYDRHSYGHAVERAARKAGVPHWHPHRLKHSCSTDVRKDYGAEAAQVFVGHSKLSTTEIYAEANWKRIQEIALEIG